MGEVYIAHDTLLDRLVAVKFIAGVAPSAAERERFRTEARAVARVQHPNVVGIHRVGEVQGRPYLVSELVRGESLARVPRPLLWQRVLELGIGLARGMAVAHRRGVLHRDIKPANVMLTEDGQIKLLDFGVAKLLDVVGPPATRVTPLSLVLPQSRGDSNQDTIDAPGAVAPSAVDGVTPLATGRIGTPLYMAPEVLRGEPATPRSDVYSLGVVLYELCSGSVPFQASTVEELSEAIRHGPLPLSRAVSQIDPSFAAIVTRCLERDLSARFSSAEALREALEELQERARDESGPIERPYPGLHSFTAQDRATFFGRISEVRTVLERLRAEPLVVVAGDSGAGKSSLCRAGVLPHVVEGASGLGASWRACEMLPGRQPVQALAAALAVLLGHSEAALADMLWNSPSELGRWVRAVQGDSSVLLFVDQLEEVLTLAVPVEAERFTRCLESLASMGPRLRVLATARGDFLGRLAALPGLGEHFAGGLLLLPHVSEFGLREAVTGPAQTQGFTFESDQMVEELVTAGRAEGALPLLQFALSELWERRDLARRVIPAVALSALGGVEGALARHADRVLAGLRPGARDGARKVLGRLVLAEGTRARRTHSELLGARDEEDGEARVALEALVRSRLVLVREATEGHGVGTYELAHEALLRGWDTLRGWLASGEEQRVLRQRLERACAEWERLDRAGEQLWSERQLAEVVRLDAASLNASEMDFLRASRRRERRRWLAGVALVLLFPVTAVAVWGGSELRAQRARDAERAHALEVAEQALRNAQEKDAQVEALRRLAFERFDAGRTRDAEPVWARALALAREESANYDEATQVLDAALLHDSRPELRRELGEVLYRYILLAERDRREEVRALLLKRLDRVDDIGEFHRRLVDPAHVHLESSPTGVEVLLEEVIEEKGQMRWSSLRPLGRTPIEDVVLAPGPYRLTLMRPGEHPVYYPVLLGRGERFEARVPLPSIPDGYVYVPPGRFLYGSADDEKIRLSIVRTRPLHERSTGGFFIARHEVTYADWLKFLRALPAGMRTLHRPHGTNYFGTIGISERADGRWELLIEHGKYVYRAKEGEPLRYPERDQRAAQDWLTFPVSGVSWEGSLEYLAWLESSGQLRGARMCNEVEWERAARGADGRDYPNGNRLDPDDANFDATYGRKAGAFGPDGVGLHPVSDSPFGVTDMAGNVWEWMGTDTRPQHVAYGGGSFYEDMLAQRGLNHGDADEAMRSPLVGLRVCATVPEP